MEPTDDSALLRQYAESNSDEAFAALVQRHVNLVYSVGLRQTGKPHAAEEITQAVFIILAKKAAQLRHNKALSSWLFQATRLTANNFIRSESRRRHREEEAYMQSILNESGNDVWPKIAPLLDSAVANLREKDRQAILLRFYEGRNLREVGVALGASEDAAEKRVNRALEKLRKFFAKRGVSSTTVIIAGTISANSVQAAPVALAKTVTAVAIVKGAAASGSTLTLIKGALKIMAWTKMKTTVVIGVAMLLAAGTTTIAVKTLAKTSLTSNPSWANDSKYWRTDTRVLDKNPPVFILRPTRFPNDNGSCSQGEKLMVMNAGIQWLLAEAYGASENRMVLPDNLPKNHFDLMFTLPGNPSKMLQQELSRQFGLTAHHETRDNDELVLKVTNPNASGLQPSNGNSSTWRGGAQEIIIKNWEFGGFADSLESRFGKPVINQTGLNGHYDIHLQWKPQPGESKNEGFRQALLDQLGLELIPTNMPTDMLVVEKAK